MANKPNLICIVCGTSLLPGAPRYRRGLASLHADCGKDKKEGCQAKTAALTRLIPRRMRMDPQGDASA